MNRINNYFLVTFSLLSLQGHAGFLDDQQYCKDVVKIAAQYDREYTVKNCDELVTEVSNRGYWTTLPEIEKYLKFGSEILKLAKEYGVEG